MDRASRPRVPALSLVVPGASTETQLHRTDNVQTHLQAESAPKQKRLFPVACRVVPTDQWFTSRVDRTWRVLDLKLWLLSKALPRHTLPLPASYRPSSPVTFASPLERPAAASSYNLPPPPPSSPLPPPTQTPQAQSSRSPSPQPASPLKSSVSDSPRLPSTSAPLNEHDRDNYDSLDRKSVSFDLDDEKDLPRATLHSIPYSFSTGAPAISGLDVLKAKATPVRGYAPSTPSVDPDLINKADSIGRRWRVYSFSTSMLLADDLPLSEYAILPYELLELHHAGAYVGLPRTFLPHPVPCDDDDASSDVPVSPQFTARAYSMMTRKPSPLIQDPQSSDTDDDISGLNSLGISPYSQPYFDGWVSVLNTDDPGSKDAGAEDVEGPGGRRVRRRARAKSDTTRALRNKDRAKDKDREWSELQKLLGPDGGSEQDGADRWRKRWIMVREGVLTVWKERRDVKPEASFDVASCIALHDETKLSSVLRSSSSTSVLSSSLSSIPSHPHLIIVAIFRNTPRRERKMSSSIKDTRKGGMQQQRQPRLIMKLPDEGMHEHLLRIFHRLAYSTRSAPSHPTTGSSMRTLRTDFLPNPLPHPLSLSFSEPSPVVRQSDSASDQDADSDAPSSPPHRAWIGLGRSTGVRFPEWREYVLRRAIRAGLGYWPVADNDRGTAASMSSPGTALPSGATDPDDPYGFSRAERPYLCAHTHETDSERESDSDVFSEAEWEGWAYDLDRPHTHNTPQLHQRGKRPEGERGHRRRSGTKTPYGSPASELDDVMGEEEMRRRTLSFVMVGNGSVTPPMPLTPLSGRLRASTVSGSSAASPTSADEVMTVHQTTQGPTEARRMRGLMRGLSVRAGRESFMRSLENALDFVEGK